MMNLLLIAGLTLLPQVTVDVPPDLTPEPPETIGAELPLYQTYLKQIDRAKAAPAIRMQARASVRAAKGEQEVELGTVQLRLNFLRPYAGEFRMQGEFHYGGKQVDLNTSMIGDGHRLLHLDHQQKWFHPVPTLAEIGYGLQGIDTVRAWSGVPFDPPLEVQAWKAFPEHPQWSGMRLLYRQHSVDLRFDEHLQLRVVRVTPRTAASIAQIMEYEIQQLDFPNPKTLPRWTVALPGGYRPRPTSAADSTSRPPASADGSEFSHGLLPVGSLAPEAQGLHLDGTSFQLSSLRGKTVLLAFCFSASIPCRSQLALLQKFWDRGYQRRSDLALWCINTGDSPDTIEKWWQEEDLNLPVLRQTKQQFSKAFQVRYYPSYYLLDPSGHILWASSTLDTNTLQSLLAKSGSE